jgi:opacity protein-like surface antigen
MKKTITKIFAVAGMVAATMFTSNAQISVGLTGGVGLPLGDFAAAASTGIGGGLQGRYHLNDNLAIGLNFGYYTFSGISIDMGPQGKISTSFNIIPVTASCEYFFSDGDFKPFAALDLGMYSLGAKVDATASNGTTLSADSPRENKFGFGIGAGAAYGLSDKFDLIGSVKYNTIVGDNSNLNWIGVNVGVSMKFD